MPTSHEEKIKRIREVAMTVREPRNAQEIAEAADVAPNTARKYLRQLVETNSLVAVESGRETLYYPDPTTQRFDQIRDMIEENTKQELVEEIDAIESQIETWKEEYGVDSPDELRASISGKPEDERRSRLRDAEDWEYFKHQSEMIGHAVMLYDAVEKDATEYESLTADA
jgi:sugar-specific transcriptional regulator TrmB